MKKANIYISSYTKKPKFANLSELKPWDKILEDYGCMTVKEIRTEYCKLLEDFNSDNLVSFLSLIDKHFKEAASSQVKSVYDYIGKTSGYKRVIVGYEDDGGDRFVDYFLLDINE